ncbi:hypothetical protein, conserved [Plasmodium berghei]|uniref:Uncharacterized protein n=1 Tax=Plasmodium berghei TaxID=5821 RepID=A0A113R581_PLABE|nr:hypothetical protein, conserved [Plasmodium berghei]
MILNRILKKEHKKDIMNTIKNIENKHFPNLIKETTYTYINYYSKNIYEKFDTCFLKDEFIKNLSSYNNLYINAKVFVEFYFNKIVEAYKNISKNINSSMIICRNKKRAIILLNAIAFILNINSVIINRSYNLENIQEKINYYNILRFKKNIFILINNSNKYDDYFYSLIYKKFPSVLFDKKELFKMYTKTNLIDEIDDIIQKIVNYNKESEIKLPTIIDNKNNVTSIISHINKVIDLIKSEYNNNNNVSYNVAKKHEEDANIIIRDLDTSQNMVNNLIQKNFKIINDLKNRKQEMENRNNLHAINRQQEITQTEHINNTYHPHINHTNNINKNHQYSSSDRKNSSKTKDTENSVRYAGAITLGLVAFYVIIRIKEKKDKDEMEFDKSTSFYDENENDLFKRDDEIIEIDMNEDF